MVSVFLDMDQSRHIFAPFTSPFKYSIKFNYKREKA